MLWYVVILAVGFLLGFVIRTIVDIRGEIRRLAKYDAARQILSEYGIGTSLYFPGGNNRMLDSKAWRALCNLTGSGFVATRCDGLIHGDLQGYPRQLLRVETRDQMSLREEKEKVLERDTVASAK